MKPSPHSESKWTLLGICFWTVTKLIVWVFTGWLVALMIGFSLLIFLGNQNGIAYLQHLTLKQSQYLSNLPTLFWLKSPAALTAEIKHFINANLILKTQVLVQLGQDKLQLLQLRYAKLYAIIQIGVPYLIDGVTIILLVTKLIILRLIALVLFLPVFAVVGFLGLIDGLVQRDLRRLRGRRESALLYHRARSALIPLLFWSGFLYLILPYNLNPDQLLLPFAISFAIAVFLTAKMFKKYL